MRNFWREKDKPIFALAPLAGITDSAFRQMCKGFGADVVYSELSSAAALFFNPEATLGLLRFNEIERPYVVQLFGNDPSHFSAATRIVTEKIKPDGIDINFGCPIPKVTRRGAGAMLMTNIPLARDVIKAVLDNTDLPLSLKTRTKVKDMDLFTFLDAVGDLDIKAVMIHGRTFAQRFSGPNDFEMTRRARDHFQGIILANGGARNAESGLDLLQKTGADGIGVARGALGHPWIFRDIKDRFTGNGVKDMPPEEIFQIALQHARLVHTLKPVRGIIQMRKHLCWYLQNVRDASKLRGMAAKVGNLEDVALLLHAGHSTL